MSGVIRCGDRWMEPAHKVGARPCPFVWDIEGDIVELRSYEDKKNDTEPTIYKINKFDLISNWTPARTNEVGRILEKLTSTGEVKR